MQRFPTLLSFARRAAALLALNSALLAVTGVPAQAQFGKLKKLGADAIKDAAKEKVLGKEAAGAASTSKPSAPPDITLDAEHISIVISALTPLVERAEKLTKLRVVAREYAKKDSASKACMEKALANIGAGKLPPSPTPAAEKRIAALETQQRRISDANAKAIAAGDTRAQAFLSDSTNVTIMQMTSLSMGASCVFEYAPTALLEQQAKTAGMSGDVEEEKTTITEAARGTLSVYQFAWLRERIALYALSKNNPNAKVGKEGVFTAAESAALAARDADITRLTPFFKNGTLVWNRESDLMRW